MSLTRKYSTLKVDFTENTSEGRGGFNYVGKSTENMINFIKK
ncbi:MAG: hypothetical protein CLLPBCKN_003448 [Chroococcidiopsis cubana SAG 39.79]|nr:hypothetical protein [Chroococcidiopsis cubana SAG 39.79]